MPRLIHPAFSVIKRTIGAFTADGSQQHEQARLILKDLVAAGWLHAELMQRLDENGPVVTPGPPYPPNPDAL